MELTKKTDCVIYAVINTTPGSVPHNRALLALCEIMQQRRPGQKPAFDTAMAIVNSTIDEIGTGN
jgi:hypothetical protein